MIPPAPGERETAYRETAASIQHTDRVMRRATIVSLVVLVVAAVTVMAWAAVQFTHELSGVKTEQSRAAAQTAQFHSDTVSRDNALAGALSAVQCENRSLNTILTYLAAEQAAVAKHMKPPVFKYPQACPGSP